jgi:hypothetical protein
MTEQAFAAVGVEVLERAVGQVGLFEGEPVLLDPSE